MQLQQNLQKLLKERKLTIHSLAKATNLPKSNLTKWLQGQKPNIEQLIKVANYLEVSLDELVLGTKPKTDLEELVNKLEIHSGLYEINIKRIIKK